MLSIKSFGISALALLGLGVLTPAKADVLYRSASPDTYSVSYSVQYSGDAGATGTTWFGQVVTLDQAFTFTDVGARLTGGKASFGNVTASGSIFGAIVPLTAANSVAGTPTFTASGASALTTSDVAGYALFSAADLAKPTLVNESLVGGPVTLGPGTYEILFGTGGTLGSALGATGEANIVVGNYAAGDVITADGVSKYKLANGANDLEWNGARWLNAPASNIVMELQGAAAVPEPATWAMLILGFFGVGAAARRRKTPTLTAA